MFVLSYTEYFYTTITSLSFTLSGVKFSFFLGDDLTGLVLGGVANLCSKIDFIGDFVGVLKNTGSGAAVKYIYFGIKIINTKKLLVEFFYY